MRKMWLCSAFVSLLTTNLVLTKALGTSTLMAAAKSKTNLLILALMMTGFSTLGSFLTCVVYGLFPIADVMSQMPGSILQPLLYTGMVCIIYIIVLLGLYSLSGKRFVSVKKYVHLSALNCAVMGTLYLGFSQDTPAVSAADPMSVQIADAVMFGLKAGLGFVLAALMLTAVRKRLYSETVPAAFRGFPAVMVYIGLLSMAVYAITL